MVTEMDRQLRSAVYRGDGVAVVRLLGTDDEASLQLAGDGLAIALTQQVDGARRLAGGLHRVAAEAGLDR